MQPIRDTVLKVVSSVQPAPEVARDDAWVKAQKENVRRGLSRRAYEDLRIPPRYARKSLANFEGHDEVKERAVSALYNANIFLWGPCGTGKSHLTCGLLMHLYGDRIEYQPDRARWDKPKGRFISCPDFLFEMKARIGAGESDFAVIQELLALDMVALDDFGASRVTEYTQEALATLINKLYLKNKNGALIINTNLSLEEIATKIDDRTASRIAEMCEVIKVDGPDRRLQSFGVRS